MTDFVGRRTIDLATLLRDGALLRRFDTKFVLDDGEFGRLRTSIGDDLLLLEHAGYTETGYETVYYDDAGRRSFHDHAQGRRRRFKVRTRRYSTGGPTMLEVKLRMPQGQTDKVRREIGAIDPGSPLTATHLEWIDEAIVARYGFAPDAALEPVVRVEFTRTTLFLPDARERLTLDSSLRFVALVGEPAIICDRHTRVAEVKSPSRRSELAKRLAALGIRPTSVSKYGIGLTALEGRPTPARWRPAMRVLAPKPAIRV